jgi:hypothetical protein
MPGLVQLPYTLMRVSIRATVAVGAIVGAGVVTTPAVTAGADAVGRVAVELAGGAVELAGGAVELAAAPHPAGMTARQAPAIAATTRLRRTRTSPRTSIP